MAGKSQLPSVATASPMRILNITALILLVLIAGGTASCSRNKPKAPPPAPNSMTNSALSEPDLKVPADVRAKIDEWIRTNQRNEFGDPRGTMYAGGSPLFDETTGALLGKYEYILRNHPELATNAPNRPNPVQTVTNRATSPASAPKLTPTLLPTNSPSSPTNSGASPRGANAPAKLAPKY